MGEYLTRIMGQRSLAEMYAKEVLSEVEEGAANVSSSYCGGVLIPTGLRIILHFDVTYSLAS